MQPVAEILSNDALESRLFTLMGECSADPLKFVRVAFPWGKGELQGFDGPDAWQEAVLGDLRDGLVTIDEAIQIATASGHGIGKSALVSWIILWAICTKADTKGIVTANTESQLKTKTWAELSKWFRLLLCKYWFKLEATSIHSVQAGHEMTWRVDMIPWSEKNSEAFAGLHNKGKRVLLVFDEASAIPDTIWEVAEGAMTDSDTEIIWVCFGNPTRAKGRFKDCFGRFSKRWKKRQIDSRTARMTNKAQLQAWIEDYGIDSDFVKVRVLGQFPSADVNALFSDEEVEAAMQRVYTDQDINHAARILGVDVARQGGDDSVIAHRQGKQVFPLKPMHIPDTQLVAAQVIAFKTRIEGAEAVFVDATGGYGVGVIDKVRALNHDCIEVYFSGKATDARYFNKRSEMMFDLHDWVVSGGALPNDAFLKEELCAITYTFQGDKFRICDKDEIKAEIGRSPDRADAVGLTFAYPVAPRPNAVQAFRQQQPARRKTLDYNPLEG